MKNVVWDIETDGLLDALTVVHSLVLRDLDTNEVMSCTNADAKYPSIQDGLAVLYSAEKAYGHNIIGFDLQALKKVYPAWTYKGKMIDTYTVASMRWAHQKDADFANVKAGKFPARLAGSQTLEAWGYRLGNNKGEYKDWCKANGIEEPFAQWRPEMQTYCEQDTDVNRDLVLAIRKAGVSAEAVDIELDLAHYLTKQQNNGIPFDMKKAVALQAHLVGRREELRVQLVKKFGMLESTSERPLVPARDNKTKGYKKGVPVVIAKQTAVEFNPRSNAHIERCLREHYGWKPSAFTASGVAEITEETLKALSTIPEAALITEFLVIQKRLGMISEGRNAWTKLAKLHPITGMYHIHGRVKQNFAVTHRASHTTPNIAQVPAVGNPYGRECRELFTVPPGWVQVGVDVSGLEMRLLAHFMARWDNGAYAEVVLKGDPHEVNRVAFGLDTRAQSKIAFYALIYGEGDLERGRKFLKPGASEAAMKQRGRLISTNFTKGLPAFGYLQRWLKSQLSQQGGPGFLTMVDGRRTYIKSEHAALNYLLQGTGAIVCKAAIQDADKALRARFGEQGWTGKWAALGFIHDELQLAVRPNIEAEVRSIIIAAIRGTAARFNLRIPMDGEGKMGNNWAETH